MEVKDENVIFLPKRGHHRNTFYKQNTETEEETLEDEKSKKPLFLLILIIGISINSIHSSLTPQIIRHLVSLGKEKPDPQFDAIFYTGTKGAAFFTTLISILIAGFSIDIFGAERPLLVGLLLSFFSTSACGFINPSSPLDNGYWRVLYSAGNILGSMGSGVVTTAGFALLAKMYKSQKGLRRREGFAIALILSTLLALGPNFFGVFFVGMAGRRAGLCLLILSSLSIVNAAGLYIAIQKTKARKKVEEKRSQMRILAQLVGNWKLFIVFGALCCSAIPRASTDSIFPLWLRSQFKAEVVENQLLDVVSEIFLLLGAYFIIKMEQSWSDMSWAFGALGLGLVSFYSFIFPFIGGHWGFLGVPIGGISFGHTLASLSFLPMLADFGDESESYGILFGLSNCGIYAISTAVNITSKMLYEEPLVGFIGLNIGIGLTLLFMVPFVFLLRNKF